MSNRTFCFSSRGTLLLFFLLLTGLPVTLFSQKGDPLTKAKRPSVGLVLSGGGAKGFAYIGLLRVIQEVGLPIDYIGGSSIGSIIGGLYAIGYHPDSIAKMIRSQNWNDLLKDVIDRKYIAYEEKEYGEKTIVKLPIKDKKISISSSIYKGQEVNLLLNKYFSPVYKISDFKKLQTPFLCIGTDLFTGNEVILDNGYLPMAVRSSMSIPGYFAPVDYMGNYLVDGGVVNNYPVKDVKLMGADIIIGGDVQTGLFTTREQLNSITAILDQITSYYRVRENVIGDSLTDLKVHFKMDYGMMDFEQYDSIIAFGERTARAYYRQLKALADSLNAIEFRPLKKFVTRPIDSVFIDSIVIRGNKKMPYKYFNSMLHTRKNKMVSMEELNNEIRTIYGTGFFETVTYQLEWKGNETNLVIDVKEGGIGSLSAGVHFDPDYNASLILSGSFRNILGRNSKLFVDLNLGLNPRLRAVYMLGFGVQAAIGFNLDFYAFQFDLYDKNVKINQITFNNNKASLYFNNSFRNRFNFKAGFDYEYFRFRKDIENDSIQNPYQDFSSYGTFFASLAADTRDRAYFSTRGFNAFLRAEYTMPLADNWTRELFSNSAIIFLKYDHSIPLSRRFVFQPGIFAGALLRIDDSPPPQHFLALGGLNPRNYIDQYVSFTGAEFLQQFGNYSLVARAKLQYNFYKKLYFTLRADGGANEMDSDKLFDSREYMFGYGGTLSYDSFIGPVEVSLMGSNINPGLMLFINLGFWF